MQFRCITNLLRKSVVFVTKEHPAGLHDFQRRKNHGWWLNPLWAHMPLCRFHHHSLIKDHPMKKQACDSAGNQSWDLIKIPPDCMNEIYWRSGLCSLPPRPTGSLHVASDPIMCLELCPSLAPGLNSGIMACCMHATQEEICYVRRQAAAWHCSWQCYMRA